MNKLDKQYTDLLQDILDNGVTKQTRNGETISVFGKQIRHKMSEGFPLLTTKKMPFRLIATELLWFLRGDTNIKYLVDNDCHIWDGDAYKNYISWWNDNHPESPGMSKESFIRNIKTNDEFSNKWGSLGKIYGKQWRNWETVYDSNISRWEGEGENAIPIYDVINKHDQIANLIHDLKTNPDSRRLMVSAWNVDQMEHMVLPPCHYGFQVYTRELSYDEKVHEARKRFGFELEDGTRTFDINTKESIEFLNSTQRAISLMYNARSQDVPLGTPFNIASYALLLEIIAKMVNMVPDELITNMGDCHIYKNQIDGIIEQLTREPYPLPKLVISDDVNFTGTIDEFLNSCSISDFKIEDYKSHPTIKIPLSN